MNVRQDRSGKDGTGGVRTALIKDKSQHG
jgi:hypothetical protein